ncbi:MAG: protein translocase subunit SecD [Zoogloeaceae bacterium]|jgi:preprotein translocase subunit SecD|nr:protein translocase subunit SecD [Zoogloeaceae bacterium]
MNRFPLWKNALIVVALIFGLLYTLPNFFGEVPAVQIASVKATIKVDNALLSKVETTLKDAGISYTGIFADPGNIRVRLADTDTQMKARDAIERALNPDHADPTYSVALNLLSASPTWLTSIHALPMYLGLDLRGGLHFLLQVDMKGAIAKRLDSTAADLRTLLRDKNVRHSGITRERDTIVIKFRDAETREKARNVLSSGQDDLTTVPSEDGADFLLTATLKLQAERRIQESAIKQNITTLHNRINELGVAEPVIQQQGADRIVVQLPGVQDIAKAKDMLGRTATLEVRMVEAHMSPGTPLNYDPEKVQAAIRGDIPPGTELFHARRRGETETLLLSKQIILTGDRFVKAASGFDSQNHEPIITVDLDSAGARIMRDTTREAVKRRMAILLFEKGKGEVLTAPTIQTELGGHFQITGFRTTTETNDLSLLIGSPLAAPMDIIEERTIGPSLGADNIAKGFHSTMWGFIAIAVFMTIYYLLFGFVSALALSANLLFLVALLSLLQATLTLPGIAAIALTLGMAIDANVLINERVREELRGGSTPQAAIMAGYERAWATILDSNVTTLIAGIALLIFGSGPVRGFAVVHCLGILTSMFSAVVLSRGIINLIYGQRKKLTSLSIGQIWKPGV